MPPPGHRWSAAEQRRHFIEDLQRFVKGLEDERELLLGIGFDAGSWEVKALDFDLESARAEIAKREAELASGE